MVRDRFSTANGIAAVNDCKDDRSALSRPRVCHIYVAPSTRQDALDQRAIGKHTVRFASLLVAAVLAACTADRPAGALSTGIDIDLSNVNGEGLRGPPGGLRAVHYEFCIPEDEGRAAEVRAIDPTARLAHGSRGRIGCASGQVLVLGYTHQPGYRQVLERLAALPYVERIVENHFE